MEEMLVKLASGQGLYALLFVALLVYFIKSTEAREERWVEHINRIKDDSSVLHKDSRKREIDLMNHNKNTLRSLTKLSQSHEDLARANKEIASSMKTLEIQMTDGFDKIWDRIEDKEGKK